MPLFFLLSGLFFKPTVNLLNLIIRRAKTLLIPYYLFSVFALVSPIVKLLRPSLYEAAGKSADSNPLSAIIAIVFAQGNAGLWFLWSFVRSHTLSMAYSESRAINKLVLCSPFGVSHHRFLPQGYFCGSNASFPAWENL